MLQAMKWLAFGCFATAGAPRPCFVRTSSVSTPTPMVTTPAAITIERRVPRRRPPPGQKNPIHIVMIVDTSVSMRDHFRMACSALVQACMHLRRTLDGRPCLLTWYLFDHCLRTQIVSEELTGIETISVTGAPNGYGTRLFSAIMHACRQSPDPGTVFFIVTDGTDGSDKSLFSAEDVFHEIEGAKKTGSRFVAFAVGTGRLRLLPYLEKLGFSAAAADCSKSVPVEAPRTIIKGVTDAVWLMLAQTAIVA